MSAWLVFLAMLSIGLSFPVALWVDHEDFYEDAQHEALLDELWGEDD